MFDSTKKRSTVRRLLMALCVFMFFSFSMLFYYGGSTWQAGVWAIRFYCVLIATWWIHDLTYQHKEYRKVYGATSLRFLTFLIAYDLDSVHEQIKRAKRKELRARNGIVKPSKTQPTQAVLVSHTEPPTMSTAERHLRKINGLVADLRSVTLHEHEEKSEVIISRAMTLPFEEARALLVKAYKLYKLFAFSLAVIYTLFTYDICRSTFYTCRDFGFSFLRIFCGEAYSYTENKR